MKKRAFTLTETLITLSIIGVVSVLTLPNLVNNYKKSVYIGKLQRTYNIIANAVSQYMVDKDIGSLYDSELNTQNGIRDFAKTYFKTNSGCYNNTTCYRDYLGSRYKEGPWALDENFSVMELIEEDMRVKPVSCIKLNIGSSVCFCKNVKGDDGESSTLSFIVDINGKENPNVTGRDLFRINIDQDANVISSGNNSFESYFKRIMDDGWQMNY